MTNLKFIGRICDCHYCSLLRIIRVFKFKFIPVVHELMYSQISVLLFTGLLSTAAFAQSTATFTDSYSGLTTRSGSTEAFVLQGFDPA